MGKFPTMPTPVAERVHKLRQRRRRGHRIARIELDPIEVKKLVALGYLDAAASGDKEPAFDSAAALFVSDKLAEVSWAP
jgi:hypothetical protein